MLELGRAAENHAVASRELWGALWGPADSMNITAQQQIRLAGAHADIC